jgi:hypothetical protein
MSFSSLYLFLAERTPFDELKPNPKRKKMSFFEELEVKRHLNPRTPSSRPLGTKLSALPPTLPSAPPTLPSGPPTLPSAPPTFSSAPPIFSSAPPTLPSAPPTFPYTSQLVQYMLDCNSQLHALAFEQGLDRYVMPFRS